MGGENHWKMEEKKIMIEFCRFLAFTLGHRAVHFLANGKTENGMDWAWNNEADGCTKANGRR